MILLMIYESAQDELAKNQEVIFDFQQESGLFAVLRQNKSSRTICTINSLDIYNFSNPQIGEKIKPQIFYFENNEEETEGCWTHLKVLMQNSTFIAVLSRNIFNIQTIQLKALNLQTMHPLLNKYFQQCQLTNSNNLILRLNNSLELTIMCNSELFNQSRLETLTLDPTNELQSSQFFPNINSYGLYASDSNIYHIYLNNSDLLLRNIQTNKILLRQKQFSENKRQELYFRKQNGTILIVSSDLNHLFRINGEEINYIKRENLSKIKVIDVRILDSNCQILLSRGDSVQIAEIQYMSSSIQFIDILKNKGITLFNKGIDSYLVSDESISYFKAFQLSPREASLKVIRTKKSEYEFSGQKRQIRKLQDVGATPDPPPEPDPPPPPPPPPSPYFSPSLRDQTLMLGKSGTYSLPTAIDAATGQSSTVRLSHSTMYPPQITFSSTPFPGEISINTDLMNFSQAKWYSISFTLTGRDYYDTYWMTVDITNSAPKFSSVLDPLKVYLNQIQQAKLPSIIDEEGHPWTMTPPISPKVFITYDNIDTFTAHPTQLIDIGTYDIPLILSDTNKQSTTIFQVIVMSNPPIFAGGITSFADLTIPLNSKGQHTIPVFSDPDGETVTITLEDIKVASDGYVPSVPSWATINSGKTLFEAAPVAFTDVQTFGLKIVLRTAHDEVSFPFSITVTNSAPYFITPPPEEEEVLILSVKTFDLTGIVKDDEHHDIKLKAYCTLAGGIKYQIPSGIFTIAAPFQISVSPKGFSDQGIYTLDYVISDGQPLSSLASTTITINNHPPVFIFDTPISFTMVFNNTYDYILPPYYDPEGMPISITLEAVPEGIINNFATLQPGGEIITFYPNQWSQFSDYEVKLTMTDTDKNSSYEFKINITNSPPRFQSQKPEKQRVQLNRVLTYALPRTIDDENNPIIVEQLMIPKFVTFQDGAYTITPVDPSTQLGMFTVKAQLSDSRLTTAYSFNIEVFNTPPYFKKPLKDQKVKLNQNITYNIPEYEDAEGLSIKVTVIKPIPKFIVYDKGQFLISPQSNKDAGQHTIQVCLSDGYAPSLCQTFIVTVEAPLKISENYGLNQTIDDTTQQSDFNSQKKVKSQIKSSVQMYIMKAGRDGRIQIKFTSQTIDGISNLINEIDNKSFRVEIKTQGNKRFSYNVTQKIALNGVIEIKINFPDPKAISNQIQPDIIQVVVLDDIVISSPKYIMTLKENTVTQKSLPPQISEQMKGLADTFQDGKLSISSSKTLDFTFSIGCQYVWGLMDDFSFLTINSMISMPVPGLVQLIQKVLLNFIYVDILLTDMWLPQLFQSNQEQAETSGGINVFFEENGFDSKTLIVNLGSTFVYLAVYVMLCILYGFISLLAKAYQKLNGAKEWMQGILFWKLTLILFFQQYPPILMACLINLNDLQFKALIDKVSTILGLFFVCALPLGLAAVFYFINRVKTVDKVEEMVQEDTRQNWVGKNWKAINLLRWTVTLNIMVFLRSHYEFQIMALMSISVLFQTIMITWRPLSSAGDHYITLFNEIMTSGYLYILTILTDFAGENLLRDQCGQALVLLLGLVVIVNLGKVVYNTGSYIRSKYYQCKRRRQALKNQLGEGKTVSMMPTQQNNNNNEVFIDMTTTSNHTADFFSRQPNENSYINERSKDDDPSTTTKNMFGRTSIEEEFKVEFDQKPIMQKPLKIVYQSPFQAENSPDFTNATLNY